MSLAGEVQLPKVNGISGERRDNGRYMTWLEVQHKIALTALFFVYGLTALQFFERNKQKKLFAVNLNFDCLLT